LSTLAGRFYGRTCFAWLSGKCGSAEVRENFFDINTADGFLVRFDMPKGRPSPIDTSTQEWSEWVLHETWIEEGTVHTLDGKMPPLDEELHSFPMEKCFLSEEFCQAWCLGLHRHMTE
jgi:hypothetical protein